MNLASFKTFLLECLSLSSFIKFIKTSSTVKVTFDDTSKDKDASSTIGKSNMKECSWTVFRFLICISGYVIQYSTEKIRNSKRSRIQTMVVYNLEFSLYKGILWFTSNLNQIRIHTQAKGLKEKREKHIVKFKSRICAHISSFKTA